MADYRRPEDNFQEINIEVNVVAKPQRLNADDVRDAITKAITEKLKELPVEIFSTLGTESSLSLVASVRPTPRPGLDQGD